MREREVTDGKKSRETTGEEEKLGWGRASYSRIFMVYKMATGAAGRGGHTVSEYHGGLRLAPAFLRGWDARRPACQILRAEFTLHASN